MKTYTYRVKGPSGASVGLWGGLPGAGTPVLSEPSFSAEVDSGLSPLSITMALPFGYRGADLVVGNLVETYCKPDDGPEVLIHGGTLETISRTATAQGDTVEVTVIPHVAELARDYFRDDTVGTTIAHTWTSTDVSAILRTVLDKAIAMRSVFGRLHYLSSSIQTSGVTTSIQVGSETYLSAVQRVKKLGPGNFYWFVDAAGLFHYRNFDSGTRHIFTLGRDADTLTSSEDLSEVRNAVYFWNQSDADGTAIALERSDAVSTATYGRRAEIVTDSRIDSAATAEAAVQAYLTEHATPVETYELEVQSSGPGAKGYPIETIRPGDTCEVRNVQPVAGTVFSVLRVDYSPDRAILSLGAGPVRRPTTLGMTIEEMAQFVRQSTDGSIPSDTTA